MPLGVAAQFDDEEAAALEALRDPNEQPLEADGEGPNDGQPAGDDEGAPQGSGNQPNEEGKPAANADDGKQQQDKPKGDLRDALRAARRAERRAKDEAERLRQENESLRKHAPKTPADTDELTDADLEEISADYPAMAKVAKAVKRMAPQPQANQQQQETRDEFVPPALPEDLQEVVDGIPDLLAWQYDPDQTRFEMAKAADALLLRHPQWKDKPDAVRLAEVTRRVNQELAAAAPAGRQRIDPNEAIQNAPTRQARSMGDIGGGGGRDAKASDLTRFAHMSAEDVEAELAARG